MTGLQRVLDSGVLRMAQYAVVAIALYVATFGFNLQETHPGLQATIYTLANITIRAWLGYAIARSLLGRLGTTGHERAQNAIARAILVGAVILTSR
jgi:hypothetical protein